MPKKESHNLIRRALTNQGLTELLNETLNEPNRIKKGKKFELFFESFMARQKGFTFLRKHCRSKVGEIDYFCRTEICDHPLWEKYRYLFVECKNWKEKIGSPEADHFVILMRAKTVFPCCGIYLTTSSLSPQARTTFRDARMANGIMIIPIIGKDIQTMIDEGFRHFLERRCDMLLATS